LSAALTPAQRRRAIAAQQWAHDGFTGGSERLFAPNLCDPLRRG